MRHGSGATARNATALILALAVLEAGWLAAPRSARAHDGGKIRGTCVVSNVSGRASMTVSVDNVWSESVTNLTPTQLLATPSGSATFFVQTAPRALREVLPGKSAQFIWKGRFYGDGFIDITVEVSGDFPGGQNETTGLVNCNRIAVGNPDPGDPATPTPHNTQVQPTLTAAVETPVETPPESPTSHRPTRTPISPRATRTPRVDPTQEPTAVPPTNTMRPTRTPIAPRATRTPIMQPTREPTAPRATRTPIVQATDPPRPTRTPIVEPTSRSRPTRTPIVQPTRTPTHVQATTRPTSTPTRLLPTRTPMVATRTPIVQRPTRTPPRAPTARPTRTPNVAPPTPTPADPNINEGLVANCSLRRNGDSVAITMIVENRTGIDLRTVRGSTLQLEPEGGALFFDRTGPSPASVSDLRNGVSTTLQWTGRLSPGGTMGFGAFATAESPNGPLQTSLADCGVTSLGAGEWDAASFNGECSISASENGQISVHLNNASQETLSNVTAAFISKSTSGTAGAFDLRGPAPGGISSFANGSRREFVYGARFLGEGTVTFRFQGRGTRPNHEGVNTATIECTASVGGGGGGLPDLGIDANELQSSLLIETQNFSQDSCAVFEGCVDGTGTRKLLRFNTLTPNFGPGDLFLGDPVGNPDFVYSACHMHYHFSEYADYRLLDMGGNIVARGHKQAFCLVDLYHPPGSGGPNRAQFPTCEFQGISAGWADVYHRGLDCQWIDITGVPSGRYVLEVEINPAHVIHEGNYQNNTGHAEVVVP